MAASTFQIFCVAAMLAGSYAARTCKTPKDCGANSACVGITSADPSAGSCECIFGFGSEVNENGNCGGGSTNAPTASQPATNSPATNAATTSAATPPGATSAQTTGNGAAAAATTPASSYSPGSKLLWTPCPHLLHTDQPNPVCLNGGVCRAFDANASVCICQAGWTGHGCGVVLTKTPANHTLLKSAVRQENKVFKNSYQIDGSTTGRFFADSIDECLTLCQQAASRCQSVNFGAYEGSTEKVCEKLAIKADDAYLKPSVISLPGWTYAYIP